MKVYWFVCLNVVFAPIDSSAEERLALLFAICREKDDMG